MKCGFSENGKYDFYSKFIQRSFFYAIELLRAGAIITNTKKFIASNLKVHFHLWKNNAYILCSTSCTVLWSRHQHVEVFGFVLKRHQCTNDWRESCPITGASHNDGMSTKLPF